MKEPFLETNEAISMIMIFVFTPNLYIILINTIFMIVLRKYLVISKTLNVKILKVLGQQYATTF